VVPQQNPMQQVDEQVIVDESDAPPWLTFVVSPSNPPVAKQFFPSVYCTWPAPEKVQVPPAMAAVGVDAEEMSAVVPCPAKLHERTAFVAFCTWRCPTLLRSLARVIQPAATVKSQLPQNSQVRCVGLCT